MLSLYRESYTVSVEQFSSIMNILQQTQNNTPLPFVRTDLPLERRLAFREYILRTLQFINQSGSYGVISCTTNHALIVLFGFPDLKDIILFESTPYNILILLRCDKIERGANLTPTAPMLSNRLRSRPVVPVEKLRLKMFSIGQVGTLIQSKITD